MSDRPNYEALRTFAFSKPTEWDAFLREWSKSNNSAPEPLPNPEVTVEAEATPTEATEPTTQETTPETETNEETTAEVPQ